MAYIVCMEIEPGGEALLMNLPTVPKWPQKSYLLKMLHSENVKLLALKFKLKWGINFIW